LAATANIGSNETREIQIRIYENGKNSSIQVLDNGHGMTYETLKSGLRYKAPKESRSFNPNVNMSDNLSMLEPEEPDPVETVHPYHLNFNISKFGAGLKQAVFWLGEETRIMTKPRGSSNVVHEVHYSSAAMEAKETAQEGENPWEQKMYTGQPGQVRDETCSDQVSHARCILV